MKTIAKTNNKQGYSTIKVIWFVSLLWSILSASAQAVELKVAIKKQVDDLKIGSSTPAVVKNSAGEQIGSLSPMSPLDVFARDNHLEVDDKLKSGELLIEPAEDGYVWIGDRWYRGTIHLILQDDKITAINKVDLEHYLYSVVGAEAVSSWPIEALKAQAVAARSYALYKRNRESNGVYDVDTTVGTQVYNGLDTEYTTTHEAVNSTIGQIMTYDNQVILAAFHSSSGGHTENVEDIWTSPLPYLRGVVDYDHEAPVFEWQQVVPVQQIMSLVSKVGRIKQVQPEQMTPRGRVVTMKIFGDQGSQLITGKELRKELNLKSTLFRISTDGKNLLVKGRGFGHGLGLSQWGAYYLAKKGIGYQQILAHYYQNASLTQLSK